MDGDPDFEAFYENIVQQANLAAAGGAMAPPTREQARAIFSLLRTDTSAARTSMREAEQEAQQADAEIQQLEELLRAKRARRASRVALRDAVARELSTSTAQELLNRKGGLRFLTKGYVPKEHGYPEEKERQDFLLRGVDSILNHPHSIMMYSRKLSTMPRSIAQLAVARALAAPPEAHRLVCRALDLQDYIKYESIQDKWDFEPWLLISEPDIGEYSLVEGIGDYTYETRVSRARTLLAQVEAELAALPSVLAAGLSEERREKLINLVTEQVQDVKRIHRLFSAWPETRSVSEFTPTSLRNRFELQMVVFMSGVPLAAREIEMFLRSLPGTPNLSRSVGLKPPHSVHKYSPSIEGFWESETIAPLLARLAERVATSEGRIPWTVGTLLRWGDIPPATAATYLMPFSDGTKDEAVELILDELVDKDAKFFDAEFVAKLVRNSKHGKEVLREMIHISWFHRNDRARERALRVREVLRQERVAASSAAGGGAAGGASGGGAGGAE